MKINKLEIKNVKRIKAVKLEMKENGLTVIGGNNNQGKTSVIDSSKVIIALVITLNIVFAYSVLYVFLKTGNEPSTLTTCWFAFTTGELLAIAGIKKKKLKSNDTEG